MSNENIVALIKAVPDISGVYVSKSQQKVIENNPPVIDSACENALEYALSVKDKTSTEIVVILLITQNPQLITIYEGMLRNCLAMGADKAYLLDDLAFLDGDPYSNACILSSAIKKINKEVGLLVTGKGETGIRVAECLGLPKERFIAVQQGANIPRIPNAISIIKAAKANNITRWNAADLGIDCALAGKQGRLTEVVRTYLA